MVTSSYAAPIAVLLLYSFAFSTATDSNSGELGRLSLRALSGRHLSASGGVTCVYGEYMTCKAPASPYCCETKYSGGECAVCDATKGCSCDDAYPYPGCCTSTSSGGGSGGGSGSGSGSGGGGGGSSCDYSCQQSKQQKTNSQVASQQAAQNTLNSLQQNYKPAILDIGK